jgi:hypothetical protein
MKHGETRARTGGTTTFRRDRACASNSESLGICGKYAGCTTPSSLVAEDRYLRTFAADSGYEPHLVSRFTAHLAAGLGHQAPRRLSPGAGGCFAERCVGLDGEDHRAHAASLWQPPLTNRRRARQGCERLVLNELATSDVERAKRFFAELFGWSYETDDRGHTTIINAGHRGRGHARAGPTRTERRAKLAPVLHGRKRRPRRAHGRALRSPAVADDRSQERAPRRNRRPAGPPSASSTGTRTLRARHDRVGVGGVGGSRRRCVVGGTACAARVVLPPTLAGGRGGGGRKLCRSPPVGSPGQRPVDRARSS